ncbi:MAG: MauE/DoxX family redox-associated membrane protein [Gammaproteobacteria bacterium]
MSSFLRQHFARGFVGLVLLATGLGKLLDMAGFVTVIDAYQLVPHRVAAVLGYSLPWIELGTGTLLLAGRFLLSAASLAVALHLMMIGAVLITLNRGVQVENCGCFGVFLARPLTKITLVEDLVMLGMSLWAWFNARK